METQTTESTPQTGPTPAIDGGAKASGTSERLFGTPTAKAPATSEKSPETKAAPASPESKEPVDSYLDLNELGKSKVKYKADGKEVEESLSDIIRKRQSMVHYENKEKELAEKEKFLKSMEETLKKAVTKPPVEETPDPALEQSIVKGDPYVEKMFNELNGKISKVEKENSELKAELQPMRYRRNLDSLDDYCKNNGFGDDFKKYESRIQEYIHSLPVEQQAIEDTSQAWVTRYLAFKNQDLQTAKPKETKPREIPRIPGIEGAGGSTAGIVDDWQAKYDAAFKRAVQSGQDEDWQIVTALKRQRKPVSS